MRSTGKRTRNRGRLETKNIIMIKKHNVMSIYENRMTDEDVDAFIQFAEKYGIKENVRTALIMMGFNNPEIEYPYF